MLRVRTGASGYIFELMRKAPTHIKLVERLTRTNAGLEFSELLKAPTLVIKGQDYSGVTAPETRFIEKGNYLEWLAENGYYYSIMNDEVRPIIEAPELAMQVSSLGFTMRGMPVIGATFNGLRVDGFNGVLRGDMVFNGSISFSVITG